MPSANISDVMKKAIIAIEDKRFYEHNGVDATGIARAFVTNLGDSGRPRRLHDHSTVRA